MTECDGKLKDTCRCWLKADIKIRINCEKLFISNHDYMVKMNVIDYIMLTCNLKNDRLQITSNYMKKCNRLQITIVSS
jgi:hypothetical protein